MFSRRAKPPTRSKAANFWAASDRCPPPLYFILDRACENNATLPLALDFGYLPVIPPRHNCLHPWQYDKALYRKRNEIERLFRRLKGFRRIFSRFDKLDVVSLAFLNFALIVEALR